MGRADFGSVMRRYWVDKDAIEDGEQSIRLTGDTLHHIRDVCRMHLGSRFEVLLDGKAYLVEIKEEAKNFSRAEILESRSIEPLPHPHLHLILSIPRFPVFEAVLEKSVELGVHSIQLAYSDFSFIRKQDEVLKKKRPRWEKIIQSATQQSGRGELLNLAEDSRSLTKILEDFNRQSTAVGLFAYEGVGQLSAQEGVGQLRAQSPQDIWIFVGSEGGFSAAEVTIFQNSGLKPVTLGPQVLRVETACVALISIIKYGFDQMR
jgi:16S rRNA (uracil1498-N3)-methyltransferase